MHSADPALNAVMGVLAMMPILIAFVVAIILIPAWFICKKAGFSPWLSLLIVVPFGGLVLLYVLAFSDWRVVPAPRTQVASGAGQPGRSPQP